MAIKPKDYLINKKSEKSNFYFYQKEMHFALDEIKNLEQQLIDMKVAFDDAQRATAVGLQNVYDKFVENEKRQAEIELLLQSDRANILMEYLLNKKSNKIKNLE